MTWTANSALFLRLTIAFSVITTAAVAIRLIGRHLVKINYGIEDIFITVAFLLLIGLNVNAGYLYLNGGADGTPENSLSTAQLVIFNKAWYISQIVYFPCMLATKLSILAIYFRVFGTHHIYRMVLWAAVGICVAWSVGLIIPVIFQCRPISRNWDTFAGGSCIDTDTLFAAITYSNFLTDVMILILPIPLIINIHTTPKKRSTLFVTFGLGASACVCSFLRLVSKYWFGGGEHDLLLDCSLWTVLEPALAMLAACVPALKPIIVKIKWPRTLKRTVVFPSTSGDRTWTGVNSDFSAYGRCGSNISPVASGAGTANGDLRSLMNSPQPARRE